MPAKNARLVNGLLNASFILQNLPEDLILPPLPPITDPALERTALTHVSFHGIKRRDDDFDLEQAEEILDYEKLEFVGDGILGEHCAVSRSAPIIVMSLRRLTI